MGNSMGRHPHIVRITTNFALSVEQKQKVATALYKNMTPTYEPFIEFHQLGETDIVYKGTTDKALKISFNYNSGETPNDYGIFLVQNKLLTVIENDLGVPADRVIVTCSQMDPERVDALEKNHL
mmetsp:Transcript_19741/g.27541  ORF Transcript_19741/g.27541 Transcript_19741/m.27541 type:complete len:124 (-) Transcript_19741:35-406(-)